MKQSEYQTSLGNTDKLKQLILDNPTLPLMIFVGEDAHSGEWGYNQAFASEPNIKELILHGDCWMEKEELAETLSDELCDEFKNMDDSSYEKMISDKVENTKSVKCIVIYVG